MAIWRPVNVNGVAAPAPCVSARATMVYPVEYVTNVDEDFPLEVPIGSAVFVW